MIRLFDQTYSDLPEDESADTEIPEIVTLTEKLANRNIKEELMKIWDIFKNAYFKNNNNSGRLLSQEEYIKKFMGGENYIKRELYEAYITQRLSEEFGMKYNEKTKKWCSEWNENRRFVVELHYPKGNHLHLRWGYNYDFVPAFTNNLKCKLTWHRTESSVKIHIDDAYYNHVDVHRKKDVGYTKEEYCNPRICEDFQYQIPAYTSDMAFAMDYIKKVIDMNIPFIKEWLYQAKTDLDAIRILDERISNAHPLHIPYMCHINAFLYAKNKDINNAIISARQAFGTEDIPQIIIKKLYQLAELD